MTAADRARAPVVTRYLTTFAEMRAEMLARERARVVDPAVPPSVYRTPEAVLLQYGRAYPPPAKKPEGVAWGPKGACYRTAFNLAMDRDGWTYVEGYGLSLIPLEHAWVLDPSGRVVDATWRRPGAEYVGLPIARERLLERVLRRKVYGVLDDVTLYRSPDDPFPTLLAGR